LGGKSREGRRLVGADLEKWARDEVTYRSQEGKKANWQEIPRTEKLKITKSGKWARNSSTEN